MDQYNQRVSGDKLYAANKTQVGQNLWKEPFLNLRRHLKEWLLGKMWQGNRLLD